MSGDLRFDEARSEDWPEIWSVFSEVVAGGDTYMYPPEITEDEANSNWMPHGRDGVRTYVARLDGPVVGTSQLKPNRVGLGNHVANAGWMIASRARGMGVGRRFAEFVLDQARLQGYEAMQFNAVVSTNAPAVALWKSMGFEIVGTVPEAFRHVDRGRVDVHIMYRKL